MEEMGQVVVGRARVASASGSLVSGWGVVVDVDVDVDVEPRARFEGEVGDKVSGALRFFETRLAAARTCLASLGSVKMVVRVGRLALERSSALFLMYKHLRLMVEWRDLRCQGRGLKVFHSTHGGWKRDFGILGKEAEERLEGLFRGHSWERPITGLRYGL